ncbi:MAG TPA: dihydrolipoamide acetyltransferase family protein [Candidatus Angelobacter sp.]|jgi:pyruvate dehydrogenase E2 component (dihydrolipoamide acetyltransferase)|nr:dihydrolipoamide acetyltransferase family protein [Candidatus Angelobacter sp.]
MAHEVSMPQMGYDMTEGTINEWRVKEGDPVARGDTIASIATDKADIDIEAYADGVLRKIMVQPGQTVPVGTVIAWIGEPGEDVPDSGGSNGKAAEPAPAEKPQAADERPPAAVATEQAAPPAEEDTGAGPGGNGRVKASPYARKRAAELGVDLTGVRGSGPGGRIVAQDVERSLAEGAQPPAKAASAPAPPPQAAPASQVSADDDPYVEEEPSRLRRALARAMVESKTTVPHFYLTTDVDAAPLLQLRAEINGIGPETPKFSVTDLIVRACALTLQTHPQLNASWIDGKIRRFQRSNVSLAVALSDGLIAPTLRNLDGLSMRQVGERLHDLVARAKSNKLHQDELSGGHMAVSNLGMFGIEQFSAIITPPQSSVLAVGAVRDEPVVSDGQITAGKRMRLNLAVDHRVTDGAQGAEALARIKWLLEHPAALLV